MREQRWYSALPRGLARYLSRRFRRWLLWVFAASLTWISHKAV